MSANPVSLFKAETDEAVLLYQCSSTPQLALELDLNDEDFTNSRYRVIGRAIRALAEHGRVESVAFPEIKNAAQNVTRNGDPPDWPDALNDLWSIGGGLPHDEHTRERFKKRKLNRSLVRVIEEAHDYASGNELDPAGSAAHIATIIEQGVSGVLSRSGGGFTANSLTGTQLLDLEIDSAPEPIEGILRRGSITLLAGHPGIGKSWLSLVMAQHIAEGRPFGAHRAIEGHTGILALEMPTDMLQARVKSMVDEGGTRDWLDHWHILTVSQLGQYPDLTDPVVARSLRDFVRTLNLSVLIIDTLARTYPASIGNQPFNENSASHMGMILKPLQEIALVEGCSILIVHHLRKPEAGKPQKVTAGDIRGSNRLWSDPHVVLGYYEDRGRRHLEALKSNIGPDGPVAWFRTSDDHQGLPSLTEKPRDKSEERKDRVAQVRAILVGTPPMTLAQIETRVAEAGIAISTKTLQRDLKELGYEPPKTGKRSGLWRNPNHHGIDNESGLPV